MIRHHGGGAAEEEDSSSNEEDAFSALSSKGNARKRSKSTDKGRAMTDDDGDTTQQTATAEPATAAAVLPKSNTSSMKRHHGTSDSRKARMEHMLQVLEEEKASAAITRRDRFVPEKKGSFVQPGQEHLTTNIFVGNLAPSITEEQMTDLFIQFGDLYSLKIMWPRTPEERARNRHTGFVCFINREDAEDAMEACNEQDPFNVGRRLMMCWGKNVKMDIRRGPGDVAQFVKRAPAHDSIPNPKRPRPGSSSSSAAQDALSGKYEVQSGYDPAIHGSTAIRVVVPSDRHRARFITRVASFVAKDGSLIEQLLIQKEAGNRAFDFLTFSSTNKQQREENLFYKWRVYAFCQGDGFETWRTEPFVMLKSSSLYWIPPQVDRDAATREEQVSVEREQMIRQQKAQRRRRTGRMDYITGRQLEQAKFGRESGSAADGGTGMTSAEIAEFRSLVCEKLCASRESICEAMAFCFEKSGAAKQISDLLKFQLLEEGPGISVETRTARLYMMSDILYNSQQPGVRNAWVYRDAIERMAPEVFTSLGRRDDNVGRMTFLKLETAVKSVLGAWTTWSVYNPAFVDELEARFRGKESPKSQEKAMDQQQTEDQATSSLESEKAEDSQHNVPAIKMPQGDWTEVSEGQQEMAQTNITDEESSPNRPERNETMTVKSFTAVNNVGIDRDVDGTPLEDDDLDGESLGDDDEVLEQDVGAKDNQAVHLSGTKPDEYELDDEELDGAPLDDDS